MEYSQWFQKKSLFISTPKEDNFKMKKLNQIAKEIESQKQPKINDSSRVVMDYQLPKLCLPSIKGGRGSHFLQKRLANISTILDVYDSQLPMCGCAVVPIATTNSTLMTAMTKVAISSAINQMMAIGLMTVENDSYQFNGRKNCFNHCRTYRVYADNIRAFREYYGKAKIDDCIYENYEENGVNLYYDDEAIRPSSKTHLKAPQQMDKATHTAMVDKALKHNYKQIEDTQKLIDDYNIGQPTELRDKFKPTYTYRKNSTTITKIGIRATNRLCGATNSKKENTVSKEEVKSKYNLTLEWDNTSSVPKVTYLINTGKWATNKDFYKEMFERCLDDGIIDGDFDEGRKVIKSLHMRAYFDTNNSIRNHTCRAMNSWSEADAVDYTMSKYQHIVNQVEGGETLDSEVFLHESCIMASIKNRLIEMGFNTVWMVYDAFYCSNELGLSQDEFTALVDRIAKEEALKYYAKYINKEN